MKYWFFVLIPLLIISCRADDPQPVSKIVGHWSAVSFDAKVSREGKDLTLYLQRVYGISENEASALADDIHNALVGQGKLIGSVDFKPDGRYWLGNPDNFVEGDWKLLYNDQYVQLKPDIGRLENVLISKVDDESLVLSFDYTGAVGLPQGTLTYLVVMTFKRESK